MIAPASLSPTRLAALEQVRAIVLQALDGHAAHVWLFGSSAAGDARPRSDIDVAIEGDGPLPGRLLIGIADALEESTVPYVVEVVDLWTAGDALRMAVYERGIRWT